MSDDFTNVELAQATRNHGMPLEAMRYDLTPAGLHYLLIHYDIPPVDPNFTLTVDGAVEEPASWTLEDLRAMRSVTVPVTLECAGNGRTLYERRPESQPWIREAVGTAEWTGVPVAELLERAGLRDDAVDVVFTGADRGVEGGEEQSYARSLPPGELQRETVLLAYEMNGTPLLPQHGAPLRLMVPGWYGMTAVKWLTSITAVTEPFDGYQQRVGYRLRTSDDDPGTPVTVIAPRALMVPPGIPAFPSRVRSLQAGPTTLQGRAWSGHAPIERVEVSTDDGRSWTDANLEPSLGRFAWRGMRARVRRSSAAAPPTARATPSRTNPSGMPAATRTTASSASRSRWGEPDQPSGTSGSGTAASSRSDGRCTNHSVNSVHRPCVSKVMTNTLS
jgi:DMSO/TMAO reductase YedYZ molybdopterin-dependent catalytic subunit